MSYGNRGGNRYGGGRSGSSSGYSRYGSGGAGPKPVEAGKEYNVEVTELSRRGDGVAKIQGFIIFVKGSKVGDKVKIKIETVGPRFATASIVSGATSDSDDNSSGISKDSASSSAAKPTA